MKAVQFAQYGGPEVLQVYDVPDPIPGPEDVLIQVKATSVNHLDLFQRDGSRPVGTLPFTPGLEAAGIVLNDSQGFQVGERIMTSQFIQSLRVQCQLKRLQRLTASSPQQKYEGRSCLCIRGDNSQNKL